ncbi:MAG: peptidyl-prolyl cis-trans isomerase [Flavobacteriaceae bacterium]
MQKIKAYSILILILTATACDFIPSFKNDERIPVAKVYEKNLYAEDIIDVLPQKISSQDSLLFVENYIKTWATKQLFLHQAELNLTSEASSFERLVTDYRSALYINSYKEALVLTKLDTDISEDQITEYYEANRKNFKLNEALVQFRYIHANTDRSDEKGLIKLFKSKKIKDLDSLADMALEFKAFNFNDSIWVKYYDMKSKMGFLKSMDKNAVLKKSNFIKKEDSLGLYLVTIKNVLKRNETAPVNYITPTIKQIILQKRKLELLKKIEIDLLNDAIKNQYFEKY